MSRLIKIVFLAATLFFVNNTFAQYDEEENEFRQYTSWGVSFGPNITNYNLKQSEPVDRRRSRHTTRLPYHRAVGH